MSNIVVGLLVVLCIDILLFLGQAGVSELNPNTHFYNCSETIIGSLEASGCSGSTYVLNGDDATSQLPSGASSVSPTTGNIFTDGFTTMKNFFLNSLGLKYLFNFLNGPVSYMGVIGAPAVLTFAVGVLWYGMTFFLLVLVFIGRND